MKKLILFLVIVLCAGCQIAREFGESYCEESKLNTEAIRSTGHCVLNAWPYRYPFFKPYEPQLEQQTVEAMQILNELAQKDPNDRTPDDLATAVIRCVQVKYDFIKGGLNEYVPEIVLP